MTIAPQSDVELFRQIAAENRRLKRDRTRLRKALRQAIAIVERQGGYVVGADIKDMAARGRR